MTVADLKEKLETLAAGSLDLDNAEVIVQVHNGANHPLRLVVLGESKEKDSRRNIHTKRIVKLFI